MPQLFYVLYVRRMFHLKSNVAYLDNAATTQIAQPALEAMIAFETSGRANVMRGLYADAERASAVFAKARATVAQFIGAQPDEISFVKNATEGLNLVARGLEHRLGPGDEILVTSLEHHANLFPWWEVARRTGCSVRTVPVSLEGEMDFRVIGPQTRVIAAAHVSNVLGLELPIAELAVRAHAVGALLAVDAAQSAAHLPIDVRKLDCDVLVMSAHKIYGPMGIGAVYLRRSLGDSLEPLLVGGGMVDEVAGGRAAYKVGPERFEAGTPNVTGAIGFAASVEMLLNRGMQEIAEQEKKLRRQFIEQLEALDDVRVFGQRGVGPFAFSVEGVHAHDVAQVLADNDVYVRAGNLCAAPLVQSIDTSGLTRASLAMYNTSSDIERLVDAIKRVRAIFS